MLPMNFLSRGETAGYYNSGHWAAEAMKYAEYYGNVQTLGSSADTNHDHLPALLEKVPDSLKYVHITTNNTIYGTQFHNIPAINVPLVADMSSDIFSGKHDYSKYSLIYAAAQKNLGTSGNCLVVIKKSFMESIKNHLPPMLSYKDQVAEGSILNTANVSGVYVSLLMLRWIKENGIEKLGRDNQRKADMIYNVLDNSALFEPHVKVKADRSLMNICFRAKDADTEQRFADLCAANGIIGVKGHRLVGGFRVSNYNAIDMEWVEELVQLMNQFENK
jgi:phosphoserine aminotransferase